MIQTNRFFGSVLLISGTTIGAGMLAIPIVTGFSGFYPSLLLLLFFWIFMLATAYLFLEVNLAMEGEANMITMAKNTLGTWGKVVNWIVYLLLLYSLTAAYLAGSSPLFSNVIEHVTGFIIPQWIAPLPLLLFFGVFIYLGAKSSDYVNRVIMIGLIITYVILIIFIPEHTNLNLLKHFDSPALLLSVPVLITAFGYHIIIPTLTTYMKHDKKTLRLSILVGSLLPLFIYVLWEFIILGTVPLHGDNSLIATYVKGESATGPLIEILTNILKKPWIATAANLFAFFAIISSFIGVSLSLTDFLTDGLKIKKTGSGRLMSCLLTFIPPLIFVYAYPRAFIIALEFAGAFVAILLCLMPALMAWKLPKPNLFSNFWGRTLIIAVVIIATAIIIIDIAQEFGMMNKILSHYL